MHPPAKRRRPVARASSRPIATVSLRGMLAGVRLAVLSSALLAVSLAVSLAGRTAVAEAPSDGAAPARRVVSMNPSLTETLVALGAADVLVGVDEYSARLEPAVEGIPVVGGLFNPSLEAVVALAPDLVVLVPGTEQRSIAERLEALDVPVLLLPNITLEQTLSSIETLGARVGRADAARRRVEEIRAAWAEVRRTSSELPPVPTVLVLQRDPLYVVGRGSFIDEMLRAAGARNLAATLADPYPKAGVEWLIDAGPRVILDATEDPVSPEAYWGRWPSIPAVAAGGAIAIRPDVMRPGPWIDRSLRAVAAALDRATGRDAAVTR